MEHTDSDSNPNIILLGRKSQGLLRRGKKKKKEEVCITNNNGSWKEKLVLAIHY